MVGLGHVDVAGTTASCCDKADATKSLKITTFVTYKMTMPKMKERQIFDCCNKVFIVFETYKA